MTRSGIFCGLLLGRWLIVSNIGATDTNNLLRNPIMLKMRPTFFLLLGKAIRVEQH